MPASRNRMYVAIDEMNLAMEHATYRLTRSTDWRARLAGAVLLVLLFHALFLWVLVNTHSDTWNVRELVEDELPVPIELWQPTPPPEPVPLPKPVPRPVEQQQPQPEQQQAQPAPSAPPAAVPQPVVQPQPAPVVTPQPVVQPQPVPAVVVPQEKPAPVVAPVAPPQPVAAPDLPPSIKLKKKTREAVQKMTADSTAADDLHLHEALTTDVPAIQNVPSSGLSPKPSAPPAPGGRLGAMQAQGLPSGIDGVGLNGRGKLTQAMQNHDYCVAQQTAGKPIPATCDMAGLNGMKSQGLKADAALQAAVAKKDATARYTQASGNSDYWKRVNHVPTTSDRSDDLPKSGSYTGAKDQRIMAGGGKTADQGPQ